MGKSLKYQVGDEVLVKGVVTNVTKRGSGPYHYTILTDKRIGGRYTACTEEAIASKITPVSTGPDDQSRRDALSQDDIDVLDAIDNATHDYLVKLAELAGVELNWDMMLIGDVKESAINTLREAGIEVPHPYVEEIVSVEIQHAVGKNPNIVVFGDQFPHPELEMELAKIGCVPDTNQLPPIPGMQRETTFSGPKGSQVFGLMTHDEAHNFIVALENTLTRLGVSFAHRKLTLADMV